MRFLVVLLAFVVVLQFAPNTEVQAEDLRINSISYKAMTGSDAESVKLQLNGPSTPKIFMIDGEKPRLVLDFLDTEYRGKTKIVPADSRHIRLIRVGFHAAPVMKTRVVIDLVEDDLVWKQNFLVNTNELVITLGGRVNQQKIEQEPAVIKPAEAKIKPVVDVGKTPKPAVKAAEQPTGEQAGAATMKSVSTTVKIGETDEQQLQEPKLPEKEAAPVLLDISFDNVYARRGEIVLFKLSDFHAPKVSAVEQGIPQIICDFLNTSVEKSVKRDIAAGGKYVQSIRVVENTNTRGTRVVLDLLPGNDYDLQQVFFKEDNLFVLIVNILDSEPASSAQ